MRTCVGSDEVTHLIEAVREELQPHGHAAQPVGALAGIQATWPRVARNVAEAVAFGQSDRALLFCWQ